MQGFTGTKEDFDAAYSHVTEAKENMHTQINTLRDQIEDVRSGWQGMGGAMFQQVMQRYDEKANACLQVLQNIGDMLQQSGQAYQAADEEQQQQISRIGNALG